MKVEVGQIMKRQRIDNDSCCCYTRTCSDGLSCFFPPPGCENAGRGSSIGKKKRDCKP